MRLTPERVRELLAVEGAFGSVLLDAELVRDLAADLLDARTALATERERTGAAAALRNEARAAGEWLRAELAATSAAAVTRADAAEADRDYWREQATAAAPCVDEIRRLTLRVVRGGTGCALDPVLAIDTAIATLDGMMVSIERIASERDAARAEADALRAECERLGAALRMIGQDNARDTADLARLHALVACEPQAADLHDHTACVIAEVARLRARVTDAEAEASRWGDALVAIGEAIGLPGAGSAEIVAAVTRREAAQ